MADYLVVSMADYLVVEMAESLVAMLVVEKAVLMVSKMADEKAVPMVGESVERTVGSWVALMDATKVRCLVVLKEVQMVYLSVDMMDETLVDHSADR
jgi:hypothetical protein